MIASSEISDYNGRKKIYRYTVSFLLSVAVFYVAFQFFFDISQVSGNSMYPNFNDGDIVVSVKAKHTDIKRGDVLNINSEMLSEGIIKRVIAIGGDTISFTDDGIYLNDKLLSEPYLTRSYDYSEFAGFSVTVPNGCVFVLGDNRSDSTDSRDIGCISLAEVDGRILFKL